MGWSEAFVEELAKSQLRPRWLVRSLQSTGFAGLGGILMISSHAETYYSQVIAASGHQFSAGAVRPGSWDVQPSEMRIALTGGPFPDTRGQLVQVLLGFPGWSIADYQPVLTGQVQGYSRANDGTWYLTIRSVLGSLVCRQTQTTGQSDLFGELDDASHDTVVGATAYTPGDAFITVGSTAGNKETGGSYLLEVTPDSGDPFLITASGTGVVPTRFTGLGPSGVCGTTFAAASTGNKVRVVGFINDHPVNVARKVILSTGGATSSIWDTLPDRWGVGLPEDVVDLEECDLTIALDSTTSALKWAVYTGEPVKDGLGWLQSWLAPAGYFLSDHHGQLAVRMGLSPTDKLYEIEPLTDADIVSIDRYDAWDPSQPLEWARYRLKTPDGGATNTDGLIETIPADYKQIVDLAFVNSSETTWRSAIGARLSPWSTRIAEVIEVRAVGWRLAAVGPGSHVTLTTWKLPMRLTEGTEWLVLSSEPDWFGAPSVRLTLARVSASEEVA